MHKGPVFRRINLPEPATPYVAATQDPLPDDLYSAAHKRGERREKQSRNWDKERAIHEKGELERLLEELRGPDWLKLIGVNVISEAEAKRFKLKRNIFISRAKTMLERYDAWRERDRELKLERERKLAQQYESSSEAAPSGPSGKPSPTPTSIHKANIDPPQNTNLQDLNQTMQPPTAEEDPIESFYEKPHLRDATLKGYRRGRHALAFGQSIPDLPEFVEFELPFDTERE